MYKHARAPIHIGPPRAVSAETRRFQKGEALLLAFVQGLGPCRVGKERKDAIKIVRRAGVWKFLDRLPAMIFLARDPIAGYRFWCEVMGFRDETRASSSQRSSKVIPRSRRESIEPQPAFGLPQEAKAKLIELKARLPNDKGQARLISLPKAKMGGKVVTLIVKKKTKNAAERKQNRKGNKSKAGAGDVFSRMRRLPGSAFSNQR